MRKRHVDKVGMAVERLIDGPEASLRRLCAGIRQPPCGSAASVL